MKCLSMFCKDILFSIQLFFKIVKRPNLLIALSISLLPLLVSAGDGDLDLTFDGDGKVITDFGGGEFSYAAAIQADGKIVAAGYTTVAGGYDFSVSRYNTDGSLDTSFDGDGLVTTDFGTDDIAHGVAIQSDGKIVVAGYTNSNGLFCSSNNCNFALARYNPDGSLDSSFDGDGKVTTDFAGDEDFANGLVIQADGKIVAAGGAVMGALTYFALVRYSADGSLDSSFDGDGKVTTDLNGNGQAANAVAIQTDGKIVAAGSEFLGFNNFGLARYNNDGSLDNSFDGDGKVITDIAGNDEAYAIAIQSDGKIVVAGLSNPVGTDFVLTRYNPDGSLDSTLDGDGIVFTDFGGTDYAEAVAIQTDGKIVAGGRKLSPNDFALARYNPDGSLDSSFDGDGKVLTDFGGGSDSAKAIVIQADGKIVVSGYTSATDANFALARYGTTDTNTPPVATGDTYSTQVNTDLIVPPPGLLGNDSDADGDPLTAVLNTGPMNGTLTLNSDGSFIYKPNAGFTGADSFAYVANDGTADSNVAAVIIDVACIFCDYFEDGVLDTNWSYIKDSSFWTESGGNLIGTNLLKKTTAFADPAFPANPGCIICSAKTVMSTAGGAFSRVWLFFGAQDSKNNLVELMMKEDTDRWVLKQRVNKTVVAKAKAIQTIDPNVFYTAQIRYNGTNFIVSIDGLDIITMPPAGTVTGGSVGFKVKKTTGTFQYMEVNP